MRKILNLQGDRMERKMDEKWQKVKEKKGILCLFLQAEISISISISIDI